MTLKGLFEEHCWMLWVHFGQVNWGLMYLCSWPKHFCSSNCKCAVERDTWASHALQNKILIAMIRSSLSVRFVHMRSMKVENFVMNVFFDSMADSTLSLCYIQLPYSKWYIRKEVHVSWQNPSCSWPKTLKSFSQANLAKSLLTLNVFDFA
jgi:hypothetical protein